MLPPHTRKVVLVMAPLILTAAAEIVSDPAVFAAQTYDYLIVGGGTAGLAVASRLSEDPKTTVGVIEARQNLADDPLIFIPALFGHAEGQPKYDWMLETVPQLAVNGRVFPQPRGKTLGGSSALNYMAYDRASAAYYDAWTPFGGSEWGWKGLLPFFKKAEHVVLPLGHTPFEDLQDINHTFQGIKGLVQISYNSWYSDITSTLLRTMSALGIPINVSPDNGTAIGVYNCLALVNRTSGRRSYAENTYHAQALHRPNYSVILGAEVTKIVLAPRSQGSKATGVTFRSGGQIYTVHTEKEVVLSAGTFKTPQLLELSGIGNKSRLQSLGIPVISNLPGVGENLQDHIFVPSSFALKPGFTTFDILANDPAYAAEANATYYKNGTGIYAATQSTFAFIGLQKFMPQSDIDKLVSAAMVETAGSPLEAAELAIQAHFVNSTAVAQLEIIMFTGHFSPSTPAPGTSYITLLMALQHPWSRGSVHITSTNFSAPPSIDPHYLKNPFDLKVLIQASRFARKIAHSQPLAKVIAEPYDPPASTQTDADFEAYAKESLHSVSHPIGTAAMAPRAMGGVVNSRLVVHGTSNLRVVDASVIPIHLATHIQQTVYAIAEKAAVMIREDA